MPSPGSTRTFAYGKPITRRPDPKALARLVAQHQAYAQEAGVTKHLWHREQVITLGKLFVQAWHCYPNSAKLRSMYSMPDYNTVKTMFGSLDAYHAVLGEIPA